MNTTIRSSRGNEALTFLERWRWRHEKSGSPSVDSYKRFGVRRLAAAFTLTLFLLVSAAGAEPKKLRIVTTIHPVYCFTSGVVGTNAEVLNLLPANVGPHDYQLSPSDLRKIKDADLIVFNGAGLDNWIKKAVGSNDRAQVLDLSLSFKSELIESGDHLEMEGPHKHGHDHDHSHVNPHFWLDPQMAGRCVTNILAVAQKLDRTRAAQFAANAEIYVARLMALDSELAQTLAPFRMKSFVVQHDALPYFVRRYGLKQAGVLEQTADVAPSPRYLRDLMVVIREKNVPVIFTLKQSSPRLANQIARDAKIRTAELDPLESGPMEPLAYEQGMRRNAATMAKELK